MSKKKLSISSPADNILGLQGVFEVALRDCNGGVVEYHKAGNTVVTRGRREVLDIIRTGGNTKLFGWMAVGTDTTAPATGNTLLGSEIDRNAINSYDTTNLTSNPPSWQAQASWNTDEANTTLGEVGIFNTSSANTQTLLARATFSTINKTTSNTLAVSYTISN
jgi:hypothetical protein